MAHIDQFIGGTGVGIADVIVEAADAADIDAAGLLWASWNFYLNPTSLEVSCLVDAAGPAALMVAGLFRRANTTHSAFCQIKDAITREAEGG